MGQVGARAAREAGTREAGTREAGRQEAGRQEAREMRQGPVWRQYVIFAFYGCGVIPNATLKAGQGAKLRIPWLETDVKGFEDVPLCTWWRLKHEVDKARIRERFAAWKPIIEDIHAGKAIY
jgi:hypothetical protein